MVYRKISMNRKPVGRKANRPGKYAKHATTRYNKAATGLQRLFRGHVARRRASANRVQHKAIRAGLRKGISLRGKMMGRIRKGAYQSQWKAHRNRYSMKLRNRGTRGPVGKSWF